MIVKSSTDLERIREMALAEAQHDEQTIAATAEVSD